MAHEQRIGQAVRQVVARANLVRHRVCDAEERVGKGLAGDRRGIVHLLARLEVVGTIVIRRRQVLEQKHNGLARQALGVVCRKDRHVRLERVHQRVDATPRSQGLWHVEHQLWVNDGHARCEEVVGQRVLGAGLVVSDDRKWCHLGACATGRRDAHHGGLAAALRQLVHALADVHEAHGEATELSVGHLIHEPHHLGCVHRRSATQCDDHIRAEVLHLLEASLDA
mmetsp:Transcript_36233/g.74071  ORF Transcript_36233/g.74071 Transcript_36233/m.74071 type:complete len:225 (+) Transcript_36233:646-1320(+)